MVIRIRVPWEPGNTDRDKKLGPAIGRIHRYDEMRKVLDVALGEPHRHRERPILRQP